MERGPIEAISFGERRWGLACWVKQVSVSIRQKIKATMFNEESYRGLLSRFYRAVLWEK